MKREDVTEAEKDAIATEAAAILKACPEIEPYDAILQACKIVAQQFKPQVLAEESNQ